MSGVPISLSSRTLTVDRADETMGKQKKKISEGSAGDEALA